MKSSPSKRKVGGGGGGGGGSVGQSASKDINALNVASYNPILEHFFQKQNLDNIGEPEIRRNIIDYITYDE